MGPLRFWLSITLRCKKKDFKATTTLWYYSVMLVTQYDWHWWPIYHHKPISFRSIDNGKIIVKVQTTNRMNCVSVSPLFLCISKIEANKKAKQNKTMSNESLYHIRLGTISIHEISSAMLSKKKEWKKITNHNYAIVILDYNRNWILLSVRRDVRTLICTLQRKYLITFG